MGQHVVIGEGDRDKAFLEQLCNARGIEGLVFDYVGGNAAFGKHLLGMSALPTFPQCQSILLMSDNDESAEDSFKAIRDQLKEIDFPVPTRPLETAKKKDRPTLAVLMLPYPAHGTDLRGCLETLLIPAMQNANPTQAACVDQMLACAGVMEWKTVNSQHKAKVRSLISAVHENDPMKGLCYCFDIPALIPLNDAAFNETALVLTHFAAWSASDEKSWTEWRRAQGI